LRGTPDNRRTSAQRGAGCPESTNDEAFVALRDVEVLLHLNNCGAAICTCRPDNEDNQVDDAVLGRTY
jgi:hypothetical protein